MKQLTLFFAFILFSSFCHAQKCEQFERALFHLLPKYIPDDINCIDADGNKQGWWIDYKVITIPPNPPYHLREKKVVESYAFGKYQNDKKIGDWESIQNAGCLIFSYGITNYSYNNETTRVHRKHHPKVYGDKEIITESIQDSLILSVHIVLHLESKDTFSFYCDGRETDKGNVCKLYSKGKLIRSMPYEDFKSLYDDIISLGPEDLEEAFFIYGGTKTK